ncbi:25S rRNA (cytosine-C(5))-methyltransferase NSUN5 isoform X2 [Nymphaea colorata]|uniref:25S rRNA (cytosine-C(5))-methyltransferase NSUN5 isoform X2 n=1 Tax=Nymphaea colorata TaxID=210225 RepID=UPI00129DF4BD|nr:25S rRNA (cytosine-C(5))-methyltransferase NSUN5 isoform X2 [Nymphaea colorata]
MRREGERMEAEDGRRRRRRGSGSSGVKRIQDAKGQERSSYFARREAARVLRCVLRGDAQRKAVASIKTLVYSPSVRNKKATFALVCQTLKHLPLIKKIVAATDILTGKLKRQEELVYIIAYDILFGQAMTSIGVAEYSVLSKKDVLLSALAQICKQENVKCYKDLLIPVHKNPDFPNLRFVRVNTLKMDVDAAVSELEKEYKVIKDVLVPDLLALPSGVDLHNHPLVTSGSIFLQVLDACSAPGNKAVQMAALMRGTGRIVACELNKERVKLLEETVKRSGAPNVEVSHVDFLKINSKSPLYSKVRAILLDPSCSGSGTSTNRLDYLLPSYDTGHFHNGLDAERARKLSAFQKKALAHALSFPSVERVVYSTCSIHQEENEDVIKTILPIAESLNFHLEAPFPQWPRRGLPVFGGAEHLLRIDPADGMEGFFIALFVRKHSQNKQEELKCEKYTSSVDCISEARESKVLNLTNRQSGFRNLPEKIKHSTAKKNFRMYTYVKVPRAMYFLCMTKRKKLKRKQHCEMHCSC